MTNQQDSDSRRQAETEKLLCRTIIRLTLSASGLDPNLDPHLNGIRDKVRRGIKPGVPEQLDKLSEGLLRADEESPPPTPGTDVNGLFRRLVGRVNLTGDAGRRFTQLTASMRQTPEAVSDQQIDELLELLVCEPAAQHPAGLIGRLFAGRKGGQPNSGGATGQTQPNQQLRALLDKLSWPGQLNQDIASLGQRLGQEAEDSAWVTVIEDLTRLVSSSLMDVQSEMVATEGFLKALAGRLRVLDQHVQAGEANRQESINSGEGLNQSVTSEVGGIARSIRSAPSIQQMRSEVVNRLDNIQQHVRQHLEQERARHLKAEQEEKRLRSRLQNIENETAELRSRILDTHHQAITDPVTGLPNRLAYDERLEQEYLRWKRFAQPLSLLVWDVDDFKQINDRFGHRSGDKALRVIGQILKQRLRETDFVARYGGEEFVMLLTGAAITEALQIANETRELVCESGFRSGDRRIEVTISCGVSEFLAGDHPGKVFERADKALYQAKRSGKNCCVGL